MNEGIFKPEEPKKMDVFERVKRFGNAKKKMKEFTDPSTAELRNIVGSEYYPIRRIDVERLLILAEFSEEDESRDKILKILDLGGGKGLLAKLLADAIKEKNEKGTIVDLDKNQKTLKAAEKFYGETPGLHFVVSDSEKEAGDIFNTEFDLIIASWALPASMGGKDYSETIRKLKPVFFVNIGEEKKEYTWVINPGDGYAKIGEWFGPTSLEVETGMTWNSYFDPEEEEFFLRNGTNRFEIYIRKDITPEQLKKLKDKLVNTAIIKNFKWEKELEEVFPPALEINLDPISFRRDIEQSELDFIKAIESFVIREIEVDFEEQGINALSDELNTAKLFLLGETHGVKENVDIIYILFKKFGFRKLALEWDKKLQEQVEKFLETGELDFQIIKDSPDGRITAGHFALLRKLKDEGLLESFVCFDGESHSSDWDERDVSMAKNILANLSDSLTLVVAGNLHTEVAPITFENESEEHHPMGENVKRQIPAVPSGKIKYLTGQYHNYGTRDFRKKLEEAELPKARFYKSEDGIYVFELPEAHVATVPNPVEVL